MLVSCAPVCAQSGPPVPITAADAERMTTAGAPSRASTSAAPAPASPGAIAESPSNAPDASNAAPGGPSSPPASSAGASAAMPAKASRPAEITTPAIEHSGVLMSQQIPPESTQVIPQILPGGGGPSQAGSPPSSGAASNNTDLKSSEENQNLDAQLGTLREFVSQGTETSEIGAELVEAQHRIDSGQVADGLLVVRVASGSPADKAGLRPFQRTTHNVLTGAILAAAMVCPPAILALPVLDYTQIGESYDMIIGIDGVRVTNFIDFEDQMRKTRPGEIVYLTVIRNGKRIQIRVPIPSTTQTASQ